MPRTHPADTGSALIPIQAEVGSMRVGLATEATFCWAGGRQRRLRWGAEPPQDPICVAEPPTATQSPLVGPHLAGRSSSWGVRRWGRILGGTRGRCRRYCQPAEKNVGGHGMSNGRQPWHMAVHHLDPIFPVCPINVMSIWDRTGGLPPALSHCIALTRHMQMVQFPSDGVKTSPSVWATPLFRQPAKPGVRAGHRGAWE